MQIDIKGRNFAVTDDLRQRVEKRFGKVAKQVSDLARLELELTRERNPSIPDSEVAEVTLFLKGVTLRCKEASRDMEHSISECADELTRQVKRHRDKRRKRREARSADVPGGASATA
jgi:putative sigma-54 modulation protein